MAAASRSKAIISISAGLSFPAPTPDPFLFCVYHKDAYPAGNAKMEAPRQGNGADFDPNAEYRMYHGDRIPGFPQHPHRGFETVTATLQGTVDHSDSLGNAGRYGDGDVQWMTAGKGVVHGENFPLVKDDGPNPCRFFQIWLNLPKKNKMVDPNFVMNWNHEVPKVTQFDGAVARVWAGNLHGVTAANPTPDSWANDPENDVGIWYIDVSPGSEFTLPKSIVPGAGINRAVYIVENGVCTVAGEAVTGQAHVTLDAKHDAVLAVPATTTKHAEFLVLQGKAIGEPVAQHGPFVMNTETEIRQAFADYRRTQFGGWPWDDDAVVFPADKGRFSLLNGKEVMADEAKEAAAAAATGGGSKDEL